MRILRLALAFQLGMHAIPKRVDGELKSVPLVACKFYIICRVISSRLPFTLFFFFCGHRNKLCNFTFKMNISKARPAMNPVSFRALGCLGFKPADPVWVSSGYELLVPFIFLTDCSR